MSNTANITATAQVTPVGKAARLKGFYVNSTSTGTLVLRDGGSGATAITGTITPAVGWHDFPAIFHAGIHATIANTLNVTFVFDP